MVDWVDDPDLSAEERLARFDALNPVPTIGPPDRLGCLPMDIVWENPPAEALDRGGNRGGHYAEFAKALRERPNAWALMPPPIAGGKQSRTESSGKAVAQNIRRGKVKGFDRGEFEAVSDGGKVWVRYTGPKELPVAPDLSHDEIARKARKWARDQGMNVAQRGNLPRHIVEAYCRHAGITMGPRAV